MAGLLAMPLGFQLFLLLFLGIHAAMAAEPSSDALELLQVRRALQGSVLRSWDPSSVDANGCPVQWQGIQCSGGQVTSINLDGLSLSGEIKLGGLRNLKMLTNLTFSNNKLSGKLPSELNAFSALQHLDISNNLFYGRIPSGIVALNRLVHLNLSVNSFTEKIPEGFQKLRELRTLDLHSNRLSGPIHDGIMDLQVAEYIDFSSNELSGPLPQMLNLDSGLLKSLQYLNLSNNQLDGTFLNYNTVLFDNLRVFDLSNNRLSGQLPSFEFVYGLEILRLANNKISGNLPDVLFAEDTLILKELDLSCNTLSGPIRMITSKTLHILNLSSNALTGKVPVKFGSCEVVDLSNNNLSGDLASMQNWGNYLEVLDLSQNSFTGSLPDTPSQFLRLTYLNLSHNSFVGPIPHEFGAFPKISTIDLSFNQLNGSLLVGLFTSSTLAHLHMSSNRFMGSIPLQDPPISTAGSLVPIVGTNYAPLESLDLSNNQLNGSIPSEIGAINSFRTLKLSGNQFSGRIPTELSKLYALTTLDLCCNRLTGRIPDDLSAKLKAFNVSHNDLSGFVPQNLLKFPDSAFHPGNVGLIFPSPVSPKGSPYTTGRGRHGKGIGSDVKAIIIGVCTAGAAILVALALFLYYRRNSNLQQYGSYDESDDKLVTKDQHKGKDSSAGYYGSQKEVETSPPLPLKFSADNLLAPEKRLPVTAPKVQEISDVKAKGLDTMKISTSDMSPSSKRKSSPGSQSFFSSSPHSEDSFTLEQPVILKVRSPDRLAGDLFFLDDTLSFSAEELSRAPAEVLGRSSHGTSYKATLDNGYVLRVKWLREGLAKHRKEFAREAKKFGNIRHPNLVSLRGYYWGSKEHEKLILSDYVIGESLASHIYERPGGNISLLNWIQRLKIAVDLARGLNYLHYEKSIPHGNLKATNILLDGPDLEAKHADYSLHQLMTPVGTAEQILNAGALGYRAPELASAKKPKPSFKADVYAFGVILMEILTGKNAGDIVSGNSGVVDLTDWVRLLATEGRAIDCFDPSLLSGSGDQEPPKGMDDMLAIALKCIQPAAERPSMRTVFEDLAAIVV